MAEDPETTVTFYDNYVPTLRSGEFELTVRQKMVKKVAELAAAEGVPQAPDTAEPQPQPPADEPGADELLQQDPQPPPQVSQRFIVSGPRFALQAADIQRQFPPAQGTGLYHEYLPMVVFNKRSVPWERELNGAAAGEYPAPWMALLVFAAGELQPQTTTAAPANGKAGAGSGTVPNPAGTRRMSLSELLDSPVGVRAPHLCPLAERTKEKGQEDWTALQEDEDPAKISLETIELSAARFKSLLPVWSELPYLAHCRQVSGAEKEQALAGHNGWHSVLMANRFAVPPPAKDANTRQMLNIAHVVSLEGLEDILRDPDGALKGVKTVRLISLWSWTFNCVQDPQENFTQLMLDLISPVSELGMNLLLRLPQPKQPPSGEGAAAVQQRIAQGYVALEYRLRSGKKSFSWYRGPFAPVATNSFLAVGDPQTADNAQVPLTADEALIFDPLTGLFDQSYAIAWSIGRMLALSSQPFATNLLQWRREAHAVVDLLLERIRAYQPLDQTEQPVLDAKRNLSDLGSADLKSLLDGRLVSSAFEDYLAGEFATSIARRIGKSGGFAQGENYDYSGPGYEAPDPHPPEHRHLQDLMGDPDVLALLHELSGLDKQKDGRYVAEILPDQLIEWLAQLKLLAGVPFNYLVPEKQILPEGTIRFFYVDPNWTEALLDGALSIALQSSRDSLFHQLTRDKLHRTVDRVVHQVRERLSGLPMTVKDGNDAPTNRMAGFLLNSTVVKSWPGLEAAAWYAPDPAEPQQMMPMKPLRMERLSPNILLCIFPEIPVRVTINEPAEGLVFGTEDGGIDVRDTRASAGPAKGQMLYKPQEQEKDNFKIERADLPYKPIDPALQAQDAQSGALQLAEPDGSVPKEQLAEPHGLIQKLQGLFPKDDRPLFGPAAFAVQMVRVPEQMRFDFPAIAAEE